MTAAAPLLWLLVGCTEPLAPAPTPSAELTASVARKQVASGEPIELSVTLRAAAGWTAEVSAPTAAGLTAAPPAVAGPRPDGASQVQTWAWALTGPDGSYVIAPGGGAAQGPGGETIDLALPPIFVDIGVTGPSGGPLAELAAIPPQEALWPWVVGGLAFAALAAGVGVLVWKRRPLPPPPPPVPPHEIALRSWERARAAITDDHELAVELSRILRVYLDAVLAWPATARTTREILAFLAASNSLSAADRLRAGHVLDATDRLKFARLGGGVAFFDELDLDLRAVVEATRPHAAAPDAPHA